MKEQTTEKKESFACDMSSLTEADRNKHIVTIKEVFGPIKISG